MRGKFLILLGALLACTFAVLVACEQSNVDITGPTGPTPPTSTNPIFQGDANSDDESADSADDESEGAINAAEGKLVIRGNYGECRQKTDFPRNYMSIFRVLDGGAQTRIELYKSGEGTIPCGFEIQIDCTVRDSDPTARPSAYDLYDHTIDTFACRPNPPCTTCGPPPPPKCDVEQLQSDAVQECGELGVKHIDFGSCTFECNEDNGSCEIEGENPGESCDDEGNGTLCFWDFDKCDWVCVDDETCEPCEETITDERTFFEGECEERVKVTITEFTDCHGNTRQEQVEIPAPEECEGPCDDQPTSCSEGFVLIEGDGEDECNYCAPICDPPVAQTSILFSLNDECVPFCDVFPDADECQPPNPGFCHVNGSGTPQATENNLDIPLNAILNGHVSPGNPDDVGYPHCGWKHPHDYFGTCDGRGINADDCSE